MKEGVGSTVSLEDERFKLRDARTHDLLPPTYTEYVHRIGFFIVEQICEQADLKIGDRVLDVASGTGMAAAEVAEIVGPEGFVLGIDHSRTLVQEARESEPRGLPIDSLPLEYRVMDAEHLELPDQSFDVVISFSSIMHLPDPEQAISEMCRVLKPGGRLVTSYTAVRPVRFKERLRFDLTYAARRLFRPQGPLMRAPEALRRVADRHLPSLRLPAEPEWFRSGGPSRIAAAIRTAGCVDLRHSWVGRDIYFNSATEYYDAQVMIDSDLRTRLTEAAPEEREAVRREFVEAAREVLKRGGTLVYPFGAVVLRTLKP